MKTSALQLGTIAGATAGTASTTLAWQASLFPVDMYTAMDVVINVAGLNGSGATFAIQERFSDVGFVTTASSGTISTTGTFFLAASAQGVTGTSPTVLAISPMLGKGGEKQCLVTQGGTVGTLACSVYLIPFTD